ncbi:hypothetical protein RP20_CCG003551 [Aedes albopictus]|nr:hypothetical protein RP20_CCG003551 [Aedes albopictus]
MLESNVEFLYNDPDFELWKTSVTDSQDFNETARSAMIDPEEEVEMQVCCSETTNASEVSQLFPDESKSCENEANIAQLHRSENLSFATIRLQSACQYMPDNDLVNDTQPLEATIRLGSVGQLVPGEHQENASDVLEFVPLQFGFAGQSVNNEDQPKEMTTINYSRMFRGKIRTNTCRIVLLTSLVWLLIDVILIMNYADCLGGSTWLCKRAGEYDVELAVPVQFDQLQFNVHQHLRLYFFRGMA